jgi:hypothetical protein
VQSDSYLKIFGYKEEKKLNKIEKYEEFLSQRKTGFLTGELAMAYILSNYLAELIAPGLFWATQFAAENIEIWDIYNDFLSTIEKAMGRDFSAYAQCSTRLEMHRENICAATAEVSQGPFGRESGHQMTTYSDAHKVREYQAFVKPINPIDIADNLTGPYAELLKLQKLWPEFFGKDLAAIYEGAGRIVVEHYIYTLGEFIALLRQSKYQTVAPELVSGKLAELQACHKKVLSITRGGNNDA